MTPRKVSCGYHVGGRKSALSAADANYGRPHPQVLCSVESVPAVLDEARRVLRHGAPFVFIEHVVAPAGKPLLRTAQAR